MISDTTKYKIQQVASVCIRCRRCMKECIMLNRFAQNPKALFTQYLELGPDKMDRHIAYSCNECSQCTLKCPKHLNLKAVFQSLKEDYAAENKGIVPVAALLSSEQGQEKECSPEYCTVLSAAAAKKSGRNPKYLFIPGKFPSQYIADHLRLSLGAENVDVHDTPILGSIPEKSVHFIEKHSAQTLITACPSSFRSLQQAFPSHRILFYWDLMQNLIGIPLTAVSGPGALPLHGGQSVADSVRWVLEKLNCQWTEKDTQSDLLTADQDCRQILGLLFGTHSE